MAQCKISGCREQAVYGREWGHKRYCQAHGKAYGEKQRQYRAIQATLPDCDCCGSKLSVTATRAGKTTCLDCEHRSEAQSAEAKKWADFDACQDVQSLKDWMRYYIFT